MERELKNISQRLSLRAPQRESLEILARVAEMVSPGRKPGAAAIDAAEALRAIQALYPSVKSFERDFPSLCFALATGVGKTRLMGAFISYLHVVHGLKHFFVLAPNLTIYNKLIADFTPNTPKYVFQGIAAFATKAPAIITGENYDEKGGLFDDTSRVQINIFNISKINSEVRGGKSPKIRKLSEYLGKSYFDYLAGLPDLVMLMDESHRYRASAGIRAINELKPILGLELTATPFVEGTRGAIPFQNVIYDYPLARAMEDGFVKEPAVSTRRGYDAKQHSPEEVEQIKLQDGLRMHEQTKIELITYARQSGRPLVKPFLLVIARDTSHARQLLRDIESNDFFEGKYKGKVIQVDSSAKSAADEEEMISRLLSVEHNEDPTEIVIHVNMLKEGWDVTNLYTIVPLRAANARILIEQSIGRGLRLPYGTRTGVLAVDRLNIVAHDKFQEIIDEANKPGSVLRLKQIILDDEEMEEKRESLDIRSKVDTVLTDGDEGGALMQGLDLRPVQASKESKAVAKVAQQVIEELGSRPDIAPTTGSLSMPEVQAEIVRRTQARLGGTQLVLEGVAEAPDLQQIVEVVTQVVQRQTINIPRVSVVPKGESRFVFHPFQLELDRIAVLPNDRTLVTQNLRNAYQSTMEADYSGRMEPILENHLVRHIINYSDVDYHANADLLFDLAGQMTAHIAQYLEGEDAARAVRDNEKVLAAEIYTQMREHRELLTPDGTETRVHRGYERLKESAVTVAKGHILQLRDTPRTKSDLQKSVVTGFNKCLYTYQKFDSYPEMVLARVLEREAQKWFRPVLGQFQIWYSTIKGQSQYNPDFVAELETEILLIEVKEDEEVEDRIVKAKEKAALDFCAMATEHAVMHGGKPWRYWLVKAGGVNEGMKVG